MPQGIRKDFRQRLNVAEQDVQGERVLVQVSIKHEFPVDVARLLRLENGRVSFLVQNCQEQTVKNATTARKFTT